LHGVVFDIFVWEPKRRGDMPLKWNSDAAGKKEEPPSSHPDGSEGSLAGGAKWCTAVTLFAAIPRQDESGSNERM